MKTSNACPKCSSTDVVANARIVDRGHLNVEGALTVEMPGDGYSSGSIFSQVSSWVCRQCGYMELYAARTKT